VKYSSKAWKKRIEQPEELAVVFNLERNVDIYDFTVTPSEKEIIFQAVNNDHYDGIFEYELYKYDLESKRNPAHLLRRICR
jgi:TolB protein